MPGPLPTPPPPPPWGERRRGQRHQQWTDPVRRVFREKGSCHYGARCRFSHEVGSPSQPQDQRHRGPEGRYFEDSYAAGPASGSAASGSAAAMSGGGARGAASAPAGAAAAQQASPRGLTSRPHPSLHTRNLRRDGLPLGGFRRELTDLQQPFQVYPMERQFDPGAH